LKRKILGAALAAGQWNGEVVPGLREWIMNRRRIPVADYEQLAARFDPEKFDAGQQVTLEVGSQKLEALLADGGKEQDPNDPHWLRVVSKIGRIRLEKSGAYDAALRTNSIPAGQRFGLTLVVIRLVPVKQP
jgi:hypothetical protein